MPSRQFRARRSITRPAQPPRGGADYTLAHAGRQVRLGPVAFWIVVGTLVVMAGWSVATGTYFAFHDDVLKRLIARQAEMQFAYEDRIAELRAQVDRIASRQLLDQEQFEQKLDHLVSRQATLELRASTLDPARSDPDRLDPPRPRAAPPEPARRSASPRRSTTPSSSSRRPTAKRGWNRASRRHYALAATARRAAIAADRGRARAPAGIARPRRGETGRGAQHPRRKLRRQGARMRGVLADLGIEAGKAPPRRRARPAARLSRPR